MIWTEKQFKHLHYQFKNWISMNPGEDNCMMTGEDLGYKPGIIQIAKFEYSPSQEAFNKVFIVMTAKVMTSMI